MKYRIGLDLGIASVGWSVIEHDEQEEPIRIVNLGVRVFDKAEKPKDGASLSAERREKRSLRRIIRRRAHRIERTKLLLANTIITREELSTLYENCKDDIYELRYKALTEKLNSLQLSKILLHFVKHRGFKSNRKSEETTKEGGALLKSVKENEKCMQEKGYKTIGEMIFKDPKYFIIVQKDKKVYLTRNKKEEYDKTFYHDDIEQEIKTIFDIQRTLGNKNITENLEELYLKIFNGRRSFDVGPGGDSPYKMEGFTVGKCTFEKEEDRASKHSFTFEYFDALCRINNLKIRSNNGSRELIREEKQEIIKFIKTTKELKYKKLRQILKLTETNKEFSCLNYDKDTDIKKLEDKSFIKMEISLKIREILFGEVKELQLTEKNIQAIDEIARILSLYKENAKRIEQIKLGMQNGTIFILLNDKQIEELLKLNPTKFGNLSIKAMQKIIPYLEQGLIYDKACKEAGYEHNVMLSVGEKDIKIQGDTLKEVLNEIKVPVVKRAISQAIKVINAIVNVYGSPQLIHVEVAREVSKSFEERKELTKQNEENQANNERIFKRLQEEFNILEPKGEDIVKFKLYEQQECKCAYSQKPIDTKLLFTDAYQIDHIIPYSRSLDDSYNNKVLVLASENQNKGNKIPYEYIGNDEARWKSFQDFVEAQIKSQAKRMNLLRKEFTEKDEQEWKAKNLNDTKYISRYILNVLQQKFAFAESKKYAKKPVMAVSGKITSYLRKVWGLTKVREDGDLHHALDATVIAMATDGAIQKITKFLKFNDEKNSKKVEDDKYAFQNGNIINKQTGEIVKYIPRPYEHFREELILRLTLPQKNNSQYEIMLQELFKLGYTNEQLEELQPIFVSRMPKRGMKGPIHKDTIRSARFIEQNKTVVKKPLTELNYDKNIQEILGYPEQFKKDDRLLYSALVKALQQADGNAKLAFKNGFRKPKRDGTDGPIVRSVKIEEASNSFVKLNKMNGVADKGSMIRVDVFTKNNKNYLVPVYVSDYYMGITPNKAIISKKKQEDWLEMNENFTFKFSLYPNDLLYAENNKGITLTSAHKGNKESINSKSYMLYYSSADINTFRIDVKNHDNSFNGRISPLSFDKFEKYAVDVLGNYHKVKTEKRQMLEKR